MTIPTWIDCTIPPKVGDLGYLVESCNSSNGDVKWYMSSAPLRTNRSHQPRLTGWCGETNNISLTAHGVVRVASLNTSQTRCRITRVAGEELASFLEHDGYPGLIPTSAPTRAT